MKKELANVTEIAKRFRGYLPVIVDIETGGMQCKKNPILEIAAVTVRMDEQGVLSRHETTFFHVKPFDGSVLDQASLEFTGIDPHHPFRFAVDEDEALRGVFKMIRAEMKAQQCNRAVLVGHNAFFDMGFVQAATARCQIKRSPFHPFTTFDTASLAGLAYGQTVLAKAVIAAGLEFDTESAHSAKYDAEITADLFCEIVNGLKGLLAGIG